MTDLNIFTKHQVWWSWSIYKSRNILQNMLPWEKTRIENIFISWETPPHLLDIQSTGRECNIASYNRSIKKQTACITALFYLTEWKLGGPDLYGRPDSSSIICCLHFSLSLLIVVIERLPGSVKIFWKKKKIFRR